MISARRMNLDIFTLTQIFLIVAFPFLRDAQNFYRNMWNRLNFVQPKF